MKVVLNKDVSKMGFKGDVLEVKPGYYRNFLANKGLAEVLTRKNEKLVTVRKEKLVKKKAEILENAKSVLDKINGKSLEIKAKANDKGVLFASISLEELIIAIEANFALRLDPSFVKMGSIKEIGEHKIGLSIGGNKGEFILKVVNE